tara:strand:+ start:2690 stop:3592 length:903 start_codon:yes stop_codon:yes gene_type:complete
MFHNPVLLNKSIDGLNIKPNGIYVDVTFGGGGHSALILKKLDKGKLFAFDQDKNTNKNAFNDKRFKLINANFRYIKKFLKIEGVHKIDGLLADLGVSSNQFDIAKRGFSIRFNGDLDMRMNTDSNFSAKDVVNDYSEEDLSNIFYNYSDLKNSRKISSKIVVARKKNRINTTKDLISIINPLVLTKNKNNFLARVFQAIRIEVNDEVKALKEMLLSTVDLLEFQGRLAVISYHSVEDRLVKNLIKKGDFEGNLKKDFFGNPIKQLKEINNKIIVASQKEIQDNPRSRSGKLRIAEKTYEN